MFAGGYFNEEAAVRVLPAAMFGTGARAQDPSGTWQGTLMIERAEKPSPNQAVKLPERDGISGQLATRLARRRQQRKPFLRSPLRGQMDGVLRSTSTIQSDISGSMCQYVVQGKSSYISTPSVNRQVTANATLLDVEGLLVRPGRRMAIKTLGASHNEIVMAKRHRKPFLSLV